MLKLSSKVRYATRIMIFLACQDRKVPVSVKEIAEAEQVSVDYVEQILLVLKSSGLVKSSRGAKGGFAVSQDPVLLSVADVIQAVEGSLRIISCLDTTCDMASKCVVRSVWKKANNALLEVFANANIADLAEQKRRFEMVISDDYQI